MVKPSCGGGGQIEGGASGGGQIATDSSELIVIVGHGALSVTLLTG